MTMMTVKCPTCRRNVEWSERSPYRPFCSERCRLVDLVLLSEQRAIPEDAPPEDLDGGSEAHAPPGKP